MNGLEISGLILLGITFILCCFLLSRMERIKTKKKRYVFILTIVVIAIINIISIFLLINKEYGSNAWSIGSTILLGVSIFFLECSFALLFWRYSPSKQFKFIGLLLVSILCLHFSLELANVNFLNHQILEKENQIQLSENNEEKEDLIKEKEELMQDREKITGWSISSNILSHSFQTFTLDLDYTGTFIENGFLSPLCKNTVRILGLLFTILAPVAGGFVILSIVSNIFPVLKLYLVCLAPWKQKIYIFSELNERSIITAESILNEKYKSKPVIIFTDVYTDKTKEMSSELLERAKKVGAICLSTDIIFLNLRKAFLKWVPPIFKKNFIFLFMDLEDSSNLKTTIDLLAVGSTPESKTLVEQNIIGQFNKKRSVEIYIFASKLPQATEQLKKAEEKLVKNFSNRKKSEKKKYKKPFCCIVDEIQNVVSRFIFKETVSDDLNKSLFQKAIDIDKDKDQLKVLILGNDIISKTFAKVTSDMGEILKKAEAISIKALVKEKDCETGEDAKINCELYNGSIQYENSDFQYKLISFGEDEANLKALEKLKLKNFTHLNFVMEDEKLGEIYKENDNNPIFSLKERYDIANIRYIFYGLREDEEIIIPQSITYIGSNAFYGCKKIKKITIEKGTKNIGSKAFYGCDQLREIWIPKSVKSIDSHTFVGCENLKEIFYNGTIKDWCKICFGLYSSSPLTWDGTLFFKNRENKLSKVKISRNVKKIGKYQFYNFKNLKQIKLSKRVEIIESYAFGKCNRLDKIKIPKRVTIIEERAFYDCSGLTSVIIDNRVTSIGDGAFLDCCSLTSFDMGKRAKSIGDGAFEGCRKLPRIVIPDSVISVGRFAFSNCINLTSVTIGNRVTSIGGYTFTHCSSLPRIVIPDSVTSIGEGTFFHCINLTSIIIGNGVTSIGDGAFLDCFSLTSVTIGNSVKNIGSSAFLNCINLSNVYYEGTIEDWCKIHFRQEHSNPMCYANHFYLRNANNEWEEITSIEIPNTISAIGNYTFFGFNNVTSIVISNNVRGMCSFAFFGCWGLVEIYNLSYLNITIGDRKNGYVGYNAKITHTSLEEESRLIKKDNYVFYKDENNKYYLVSYKGTETDLVLPNDIEGNDYEINDYAFCDCCNLTNIVITNGVTSIGSSAFSNCINLTSITIGNNVTSIENNAFDNCYRLVEIYNLSYLNITIGNNDNGYIGKYAKVIHTKLKEESGLIKKDNYVFYKDENNKYYLVSYKGTETELVLLGNVEGNNYEINDYAFYDCCNITNIVIPNGVTSIGSSAFSSCINLTSVTIGNSVTNIGEMIFSGCSVENFYYEGTKEQWKKFNIKKPNEQCVIHCIDGDI